MKKSESGTLRLSVRTLVEFTLHGEDLVAPFSLRALRDGTEGHKARQRQLPQPWQAEVPLHMDLAGPEGMPIRLSGRMDAFLDGDVPLIEEIKLWSGENLPSSPLPAHTAQALCYARMLMEERSDLARCTCQVTYVSARGDVLATFPEETDRETVLCRFEVLLAPYLEFLDRTSVHLRRRDADLHALPFPYPAWRQGQREMSGQVYYAIRTGKRLFVSMPTGTGKSLAVLFPSLKALGEGLTTKVLYVTERTTGQQSAMDTFSLWDEAVPAIWSMTLTAKDRLCPFPEAACSPLECPRARGHGLRDNDALMEAVSLDAWPPDLIWRLSEKHSLCPFEFALRLSSVADVLVLDVNYLLDPGVRIRQLTESGSVTMLFDEAHHLLPRIRDMLSGWVDRADLRQLVQAMRGLKRGHPLRKCARKAISLLKDLGSEGNVSREALSPLAQALQELMDELLMSYGEINWPEKGEFLSNLAAFLRAWGLDPDRTSAFFDEHHVLRLMCMDASSHFRENTAHAAGVVCFSATFSPLQSMKQLLGGEEEDACLSIPSPFPREHLYCHILPVPMRYGQREQSVPLLTGAIQTMMNMHPGRYIAFFPSFAYMLLVASSLEDAGIPFQMQTRGMGLGERDAFLSAYRKPLLLSESLLSLCVLGGIFSEGIDLPGRCLDGVLIAGLGLPMVSPALDELQRWYESQGMSGFYLAAQVPGLQKVAQAGGRVIRTCEDRGVVILCDSRFSMEPYRSLLPEHWQVQTGDLEAGLKEFWDAIPSPDDSHT